MFDLKKPCPQCPFRSDISPYIRPERVDDIWKNMIEKDGWFSCHKTTTAAGRSNRHPKAQHCVGATILLMKEKMPNQLMRVAGRLGFLDYDSIKDKEKIYETIEEMRQAHLLENP